MTHTEPDALAKCLNAAYERCAHPMRKREAINAIRRKGASISVGKDWAFATMREGGMPERIARALHVNRRFPREIFEKGETARFPIPECLRKEGK